MCGIFGVRDRPDAVDLTKLGLYSLQHRGQESSGIVAVDEAGGARGVRSMGLVSDMPDSQLEKLRGVMGAVPPNAARRRIATTRRGDTFLILS